jgi:hypothetical protein
MKNLWKNSEIPFGTRLNSPMPHPGDCSQATTTPRGFSKQSLGLLVGTHPWVNTFPMETQTNRKCYEFVKFTIHHHLRRNLLYQFWAMRL